MRAPPPWVLPGAAGLVAALLSCWIPSWLQDEKAGLEAWPRLVERAVGHDREHPRAEEGLRRRITVVGIGSSLLTCATQHNWDMDRLSKDMGKRPVRFRKICAGGHKWEAMPLLESAFAARPDVVVIESNVFFARSREDFEETGAENFIAYLRWRVRLACGIGGPGLEKTWPFKILEPPSDHPDPRVITAATIAAMETRMAKSFHPEDAANYVQVLREARAAGITVVMLDLTSPPGPAKWTPAQLRGVAEMHELLARETGAVTWRYPGELGAEDFMDEVHLSPQGRQKFSRWFVEQLDALPIP